MIIVKSNRIIVDLVFFLPVSTGPPFFLYFLFLFCSILSLSLSCLFAFYVGNALSHSSFVNRIFISCIFLFRRKYSAFSIHSFYSFCIVSLLFSLYFTLGLPL